MDDMNAALSPVIAEALIVLDPIMCFHVLFAIIA